MRSGALQQKPILQSLPAHSNRSNTCMTMTENKAASTSSSMIPSPPCTCRSIQLIGQGLAMSKIAKHDETCQNPRCSAGHGSHCDQITHHLIPDYSGMIMNAKCLCAHVAAPDPDAKQQQQRDHVTRYRLRHQKQQRYAKKSPEGARSPRRQAQPGSQRQKIGRPCQDRRRWNGY